MQVAKKPRRAYIIDSDSDWVVKFACLVLVLTIIHHLPIWKYQVSLTTRKDVKCPKIALGHLVITWGHVWLIGNHEFSSNLGIIALTTGKIALTIARAITLPVVQLFPNWRIRDYLYFLWITCCSTNSHRFPVSLTISIVVSSPHRSVGQTHGWFDAVGRLHRGTAD